jgi:anaerobic selenocysteine-containing dehydrogenase
VLLPGWSALQESHYDVAFPQFSFRNHARYSGAVFAPPAGHPPEWQTLLRLAAIARGEGAGADVLALDDALLAEDLRKLAGEQAPFVLQALAGRRGPERLVDLALRGGPYGDAFGLKPGGLSLDSVMAAPGGIDLGALAPRLPELLRTPSGKIELAPPMLLADLPRALADIASPAPALVLIGRRDVRSNNSWMHNLPTLAKGPFRCTLRVHPIDAARCGLFDGGQARLSGHGAQALVQLEFDAGLMPGVVSLPHGWGHDLAGSKLSLAAQRPGVNLNALLDESLRDPLSGNAVLSGAEVTLTSI